MLTYSKILFQLIVIACFIVAPSDSLATTFTTQQYKGCVGSDHEVSSGNWQYLLSAAIWVDTSWVTCQSGYAYKSAGLSKTTYSGAPAIYFEAKCCQIT